MKEFRKRISLAKLNVKVYVKKIGIKKFLQFMSITTLTLLYISGLISEFFIYTLSIFREDRFFTFNPFKVWYIALTNGGIGNLIILALLCYAAYWKLARMELEKGELLDERGIRLAKVPIAGSARWLKEEDRNRLIVKSSISNAKGQIIGTDEGLACVINPNEISNDNEIVFGPTGAKKSSNYVFNKIYACIRLGLSFLLTDPKAEGYGETVKLAEEEGFDTKVLNIKNPLLSDSVNIFEGIYIDDPNITGIVRSTATTILDNTTPINAGRPNEFWESGMTNLLYILLYKTIDAQTECRDYGNVRRNKGRIRDISEANPGTLPYAYHHLMEMSVEKFADESYIQSFRNKDKFHPILKPLLSFNEAPQVVKESVISSLRIRLGILQSGPIANMLNEPEISLVEPAKKKCAYYVVMDDQDYSNAFIVALFFHLFFLRTTQYADAQPNKKCKVKINLILDEALSGIKIPNLPQRMATARSRDIAIAVVIQDINQFNTTYPDDWKSMIANCGTLIVMGANDTDTQEYISTITGIATIEQEGERYSKKAVAPLEMHPEYQKQIGGAGRNLLTPDEVGKIKRDELLVRIQGFDVFRLKKFFYKMDPLYDDSNKVTIEDFLVHKEKRSRMRENENHGKIEIGSDEDFPELIKIVGKHEDVEKINNKEKIDRRIEIKKSSINLLNAATVVNCEKTDDLGDFEDQL
ncbi:MAG: VirD4-like conjugal transfer protein, CD1115 family [Eubacteriaceae bacterium]